MYPHNSNNIHTHNIHIITKFQIRKSLRIIPSIIDNAILRIILTILLLQLLLLIVKPICSHNFNSNTNCNDNSQYGIIYNTWCDFINKFKDLRFSDNMNVTVITRIYNMWYLFIILDNSVNRNWYNFYF